MTLDEVLCAADEFADAASAFDAGLATDEDDDSAVDAARAKLRAAIESYAAERERAAVEAERESASAGLDAYAKEIRPARDGYTDGFINGIRESAAVIRARGREVKP